MLVLEEQRYIHEDLERLEQGIADRIREDPKHVSSSKLCFLFLA
jgi:splicing factor 3A subunit 3